MKAVPLGSQEKGVMHRTSERWRVYVPALHRDEAAAAKLEYFLSRKSRFSSVRARWITGSLVLEGQDFDDLTPDQVFEWIEEALERNLPRHISRTEEADRTKAYLRQYLVSDVDALLEILQVDREQGLSSQQASERLREYGPNAFPADNPRPRAEIFRLQFANPQSNLLIGTALLSAMTGGMFEVFLISSVVLLNGYIGYLSESQADALISSIGKIEPLLVQALRDGVWQSVSEEKLVVGDIVAISSGVVPADLRLIEGDNILVDESSLSGESMPVSKHYAALDANQISVFGDRRNLLFRGTIVTSGHGRAVVIAVGDDTEIGRVRRLVEGNSHQQSPLQRDLDLINRQTIATSILICVGVFAVGLWRGQRWKELLRTSISLAVAAVPEGLPTVGTTTMALGAGRLKRNNVLVRRLSVLETLGSVEVLCLDKTGTLTMNEMMATEGYFGLRVWAREGLAEFMQKPHADRLTARMWCLVTALCTDCEPNKEGQDKLWNGSSTEKALIDIAILLGADPIALRDAYPRFKVSYRGEVQQYMVTYHQRHGRHFAAIKGNPEQVMSLCSWICDKGEVKALSDEKRQVIKAQNRKLASKGLRVIGFAYCEANELQSIEAQELVWLGLIGLMDPMREGMEELIASFHKAGIKTIMMTGDQAATAEAIGRALSLHAKGESLNAADASRLKDMTLEEIALVADRVQVFSRVSPRDKLRIVQSLQQKGRIVAMTGDGINDSPALRASHVGIAMGYAGSSAARESADIVLRDDNLQILYHAIEQGRAIRSNLRKSIRYLLATNFSEILLMLISVARGRPAPLNPLQLLWINLLSDVLPGLALALDPVRKGSMRERPIDPSQHLISLRGTFELIAESLLMSLGAYISQGNAREDAASGRAAAFISLTLSQILHTLSVSADGQSLLNHRWPGNHRVYEAMSLSLLTIAAGTSFPLTQRLLGNVALPKQRIKQAVIHGIWPVLLHEMAKLLQAREPIIFSYNSGR